MQNFYLRAFLYEYSILFIFVQFLKFLVYPFSLRILWYVFLYEYHTNSFQNIRTDFKIGIFPVPIASYGRDLGYSSKIGIVGQSVIQYNIIKRKEEDSLYR